MGTNNKIILIALAITLSPRGVRGQTLETEVRLAPLAPNELPCEAPHGIHRTAGEGRLYLSGPKLKSFGFEGAGFRTGEGWHAAFGISKELEYHELKVRPGIFAWETPEGFKPAFGLSWTRHGRLYSEGLVMFANPKDILGRSDAGIRLPRGFGIGITAELDHGPEKNRAWLLGGHVKKQVKETELMFGYLHHVQGADHHGAEETHRPLPSGEWFMGIRFALHPKHGEQKNHH